MESGINNRVKTLAEVKIQRGIFQVDSLSPLLFVIAMMSLSYTITRKDKTSYVHEQY